MEERGMRRGVGGRANLEMGFTALRPEVNNQCRTNTIFKHERKKKSCYLSRSTVVCN